MASCLRNILTKNYQNPIILLQVTIENVRDVFLRHSVCQFRPEKILFFFLVAADEEIGTEAINFLL